jgi:hypothetical protein
MLHPNIASRMGSMAGSKHGQLLLFPKSASDGVEVVFGQTVNAAWIRVHEHRYTSSRSEVYHVIRGTPEHQTAEAA